MEVSPFFGWVFVEFGEVVLVGDAVEIGVILVVGVAPMPGVG
jgi:hypothetical protein